MFKFLVFICQYQKLQLQKIQKVKFPLYLLLLINFPSLKHAKGKRKIIINSPSLVNYSLLILVCFHFGCVRSFVTIFHAVRPQQISSLLMWHQQNSQETDCLHLLSLYKVQCTPRRYGGQRVSANWMGGQRRQCVIRPKG